MKYPQQDHYFFTSILNGMVRQKFKLSHSIFALAALLLLQGILVFLFPVVISAWLTLGVSVVGSVIALSVATEVIKEVRNAAHMLILLSVVVAEFVIFFAFEYWYLLIASPMSFPTLTSDAASLLLHSTMIFVFNPLYLPSNFIGKCLLLINTVSAMGLVLFVLQNIWQFRRAS